MGQQQKASLRWGAMGRMIAIPPTRRNQTQRWCICPLPWGVLGFCMATLHRVWNYRRWFL